MPRRAQIAFVALSICLQLADAALGVLGHSHVHLESATAPAAVSTKPVCHQHAGCSHSHACKATNNSHEHSHSHSHLPGSTHDDCALCRHASQTAAAFAIVLELPDTGGVSLVEPTAPVRLPAKRLSRQRSRAPPLENA